MKSLAVCLAAIAFVAAPAFAHEAKDKTPSEQNKAQKTPAEAPKAEERATEHSGGTDKYGCHTNHKTGDYHCHNPK